MLELAHDLLPRLARGERAVVVTVTGVHRSAPRGPGASMVLWAGGDIVGSISGGCVESDAIALAGAVLAEGRARVASFGFGDDVGRAAGLACGGTVDVIAYEVRGDDPATVDALTEAAADRRVAVALELSAPAPGRVHSLDGARAGVGAAAASAIDALAVLGETRRVDADGRSLLVLTHAPRARLILLGASEHAAVLCRVGAAAGFAVTVCDPWPLLLTPERFPAAASLVVAEPAAYLAAQAGDPDATDARTAVCVLTHDERLDIPAIHAALGMNVGFVGALGARRTVEHRARLLLERGVQPQDLARLHSPLGLDLGGASPEHTAVSALAEIIAARHGASARPLRETRGPLHPSVLRSPHCVS
ncbi:XdhC family protein [Microbacterium sp. LRZ72]|uniref:XdhC family protein n=1 Tax=Microbacterium sp. LRZ72 TaxID=2942481 RepID=UPI0029AD38FD|nr:XdhC family protein [Microbacterium sp. LRZ72]MDX2376315.1 XdhC family protein [Microbacterium sp. LRZ72]